MKKAFRIIVPIFLVLAIIVGVYLYLFHYDRAFTRDMLLTTARQLEKRGNPTMAAWFYDRAYDQGDGSDEVAIELARQYVRSGSYTKAEKTLFQAIKDGGEIEVYMALSKLFVQQDKLIDAMDLIDKAEDEEIRQQLMELRPAAPAPNQEPGFYNQYISVELAAENGAVYANSTCEFPTIRNDRYIEGFPLQDGDNTIYAITVGDNGLVSPLVIYNYTLGGVVAPMQFTDPAMEQAIRNTLNVNAEKQLYTNDLWTIREFTVPEGVNGYADLKHMIYLESLTIHKGPKGKLEGLAELTTLKQLHITDTNVSAGELEAIGTLSGLEKLTLSNCSLSTASGLAGLTKLNYLDLSKNAIRNLQPLKGMTLLKEIYLQHNALTEISALAFCSSLEVIDISYNSVSSIAPLSTLKRLQWLNCSTNEIVNLGDIGQLTKLTYLDVSDNAIAKISTLSGCTALEKLNISRNQIADIRSLSTLTSLTALNFSYNQVTELPKFPLNCSLVTIDGSYNAISTLKPLGGLQSLNSVLMDYNTEISSVDPLAECHRLMQVNVFGTKVTDITKLEALSIVVHYDPTNE